MLQQLPDRTMMGRQPEGVPRNRKLSTASRKEHGELASSSKEEKRSRDVFKCLLIKVVPKQVPTRLEENRLIPKQNEAGVEK
eukprot:3106882-Pleurochrysis_carterae.AAC.1